MNNVLVLEVSEKFSEMIGEVDEFLNGEFIFFVFSKLVKGELSYFCDDSDFYFVTEIFVVRLIDVKFKNLN